MMNTKRPEVKKMNILEKIGYTKRFIARKKKKNFSIIGFVKYFIKRYKK